MEYAYKNEKLHYELIGHGKPIVMLHGLGCSMKMMKACMEPIFLEDSLGLQGKYQRIYIDLPGMGKSTCKKELASADYLLEIVNSFIENVVSGDFLLAGESYGGYMARGVLANCMHRIEGLMLLCPVTIPDRGKRKRPIKNVYIEDKAFIDTLSQEKKTEFRRFSVIANEYTYRRSMEEVWSGLQDVEEKFLDNLNNHYEFSFDVDSQIRERCFQKPSLFLCGRQDVTVGYRDQLELLEDYPRVTFAILDVAGHNLQIEEPHLFEELVRNWLKRVDISGK